MILLYSIFVRESDNKTNMIRANRLHLGMGSATSWDGFGYILGWVRLHLGMG